ncbi:hypothetical protein CL621_03035 [archaeon]|nr:hypothetical protein [archaeon]|tara:strand:+ start:1749 stop:1928 length:180 start_codon:yes stop_codon:yes gene_type:complete
MRSKDIFKIILGLLVMVVGTYGVIYWRWHVLDLFKGALGPSVFFIGLLILLIGMSDLRS